MAAPAGAATGHTTHPVGTTAGDYPNSGVGRTGAGYDDGYGYGGKGRPVHRNRRLANPSPLGMFALASTLLMWSLFNARTRHIYQTNAIIGMALAVGGLCQLLAGMWEFVTGNTFAATAFTILGGFWISYGILYWPSSGSLSSYSTGELGSALGIYYMVWMIVALMLLLGTFRGSVPLAGTFFFMFLMFLLLGVAHFNDHTGALRAGGVLGCISAMLAFYTGATGLHTRDTTYYNLPAIGLARRQDAAETRY